MANETMKWHPYGPPRRPKGANPETAPDLGFSIVVLHEPHIYIRKPSYCRLTGRLRRPETRLFVYTSYIHTFMRNGFGVPELFKMGKSSHFVVPIKISESSGPNLGRRGRRCIQGKTRKPPQKKNRCLRIQKRRAKRIKKKLGPRTPQQEHAPISWNIAHRHRSTPRP